MVPYFVIFSGFSATRARGWAKRCRSRGPDVDWDNGQLIVGADGQTKNREFRALDFNPCLKSHLESMRQHRTQDLWLFPSAQRGREGGGLIRLLPLLIR